MEGFDSVMSHTPEFR